MAKPMLSMIAAMGENRVIGNKGQLPWHMPADFAHFKELTIGKPVIMGLKTYKSIGKPLPNRKNIVLSKEPQQIDGVTCVTSIEAAMEEVADVEEAMIIGGGSIYQQFLPMADKIYLTVVHTNPDGDAYFPELKGNEWKITGREEHDKDERNEFDYSFVTFERVK